LIGEVGTSLGCGLAKYRSWLVSLARKETIGFLRVPRKRYPTRLTRRDGILDYPKGSDKILLDKGGIV